MVNMDEVVEKMRARWTRLTIGVPTCIRFHPYLVNSCQKLLKYVPFLLPHDKSYYGFAHLATSNNGLFVDVGANDGTSALGFRRINKTYSIVSIEPNRLFRQALRAVTRRIKRFRYIMVGAGSKTCQKILYIPLANGIPIYTAASLDLDYVTSSMKYYFSTQKITYIRQVVRIMPLDKLTLHPDIIKLDTEGYDLEALRGLWKTIRTHRPYVLIEYNKDLLTDEIKLFRSLSYSLAIYDYHTDLFSLLGSHIASEKIQKTKLLSIFCIPGEKIDSLPMVQ